jgi:hypothetical protein
VRPATRHRCAACKKRISAHEPDIMPRCLGTEEALYFHTRRAAGAVCVSMLEPEVWFMTVRHVEEEAN